MKKTSPKNYHFNNSVQATASKNGKKKGIPKTRQQAKKRSNGIEHKRKKNTIRRNNRLTQNNHNIIEQHIRNIELFISDPINHNHYSNRTNQQASKRNKARPISNNNILNLVQDLFNQDDINLSAQQNLRQKTKQLQKAHKEKQQTLQFLKQTTQEKKNQHSQLKSATKTLKQEQYHLKLIISSNQEKKGALTQSNKKLARKNWRIHEKEIITKINNNDDFCNHIMAELPKIKQKIKVTENTINRLNIKIQELDIKEFKKEVLTLVNKKSLEILYCIIASLIKKQIEINQRNNTNNNTFSLPEIDKVKLLYIITKMNFNFKNEDYDKFKKDINKHYKLHPKPDQFWYLITPSQQCDLTMRTSLLSHFKIIAIPSNLTRIRKIIVNQRIGLQVKYCFLSFTLSNYGLYRLIRPSEPNTAGQTLIYNIAWHFFFFSIIFFLHSRVLLRLLPKKQYNQQLFYLLPAYAYTLLQLFDKSLNSNRIQTGIEIAFLIYQTYSILTGYRLNYSNERIEKKFYFPPTFNSRNQPQPSVQTSHFLRQNLALEYLSIVILFEHNAFNRVFHNSVTATIKTHFNHFTILFGILTFIDKSFELIPSELLDSFYKIFNYSKTNPLNFINLALILMSLSIKASGETQLTCPVSPCNKNWRQLVMQNLATVFLLLNNNPTSRRSFLKKLQHIHNTTPLLIHFFFLYNFFICTPFHSIENLNDEILSIVFKALLFIAPPVLFNIYFKLTSIPSIEDEYKKFSNEYDVFFITKANNDKFSKNSGLCPSKEKRLTDFKSNSIDSTSLAHNNDSGNNASFNRI